VRFTVPTLFVSAMNNMLNFRFPFLIAQVGESTTGKKGPRSHLDTFSFVVAVWSMTITEHAVGAVTVDVSEYSGFLEVLESESDGINRNRHRPYVTFQIMHPFAE
jgi:hypothetical protein